MRALAIFKEVGISGVLDIVFMSILIYTLIIWFKRSKAVFVLIGIFIVGLVYLAAREFNLQLLAAVFQGFFAVILIAVIVIFQEEIKHLFERLAIWSLNRRLTRKKALHLSRREVEMLVRVATDFARERIGALIVLKGKDAIVRHINGGTDLNGELSETLLKSIFNPTSAGHDGAVVVDQNRVLQFGCHLPLSKELKKIQPAGGTRHAAGLGLAELTDALCIVVSEERGAVSIAQGGEIEVVRDHERLNLALERFYDELAPVPQNRAWKNLFTRNLREKAVAFLVTVALWFVFVHEGRLTYKPFDVRVEYTNVDPALEVKSVRPETVEVTLSGPRRYFYFIGPKRIRLVLNMVDEKEGFQTKYIQKSNVTVPAKLSIENIAPVKVRFVLTPRSETP